MNNDVTANIIILHVHDEEQILTTLMSVSDFLFEQSKNEDDVLKELAHKFFLYGNVLVLQIDGETKGFCAFYANDAETKIAYLSVIVVVESAQCIGCGSALLAEMINSCRRQGMEKLRLEVSDANVQAIRFYQKNGFSQEKHLGTSSYFIRAINEE